MTAHLFQRPSTTESNFSCQRHFLGFRQGVLKVLLQCQTKEQYYLATVGSSLSLGVLLAARPRVTQTVHLVRPGPGHLFRTVDLAQASRRVVVPSARDPEARKHGTFKVLLPVPVHLAPGCTCIQTRGSSEKTPDGLNATVWEWAWWVHAEQDRVLY